jgi:hypothetical protein
MRRILCALTMCFSILSLAETKMYGTSFEGIQVGISTIAEVIEAHGHPLKKTSNSNNVKYTFHGFDITIQDSTGKVNTIIVREPNLSDPNGIRVGYSEIVVEATVNEEPRKGTITDFNKGIIYWLKNGKVERIVIAHKLWKGYKSWHSDQ